MDTLHYDEALEFYQRSYQSYPDPAVLYNEARVHQARADYPEALNLAQRFAREAPADLLARVSGLPKLIEELQSHTATVEVHCNVAGAKILLREKLVGSSPLPAALHVNAGPAKVDVVADGYAPYHQEIDLPGGQTLPLTIVLAPLVKNGTLVVQVSGDPASVEIDRTAAGVTPLTSELSAGPHSIVVRRPGFEDKDASTVIAAGERRELSLVLVAKRGALTSRWWFWTGQREVAVGGATDAAVLIAANTDRAHGSGQGFSPGTQTALVRW